MTDRTGHAIRGIVASRARFGRIVVVAAGVVLVSGAHSTRQPGTGFDGEAALRYAREQVAFGPRVPGTAAAERAGDWLVARMRERADTVIVQRWTHRTATGASVPMRNIFARIAPGKAERVLYVAHWDTRPVADAEHDAELRAGPGDGANDGASGVAMLMALADALKRAPPSVGVDILFVDGEDYGRFGPDVDVVIGSAYFAANLPVAGYRPSFGVVWDMIGDSDLRIEQEEHSLDGAPEVVNRVWQQAAALGYGKHFSNNSMGPITDDHVPFVKKGYRVIDVIDLDYTGPGGVNYHHTVQDTIDKISAKSLQIVGDVALSLVTD